MYRPKKFWLKFTIVYALFFGVVYIVAPDQCRGLFCLIDKDFVFLVACINYIFIGIIAGIHYVWRPQRSSTLHPLPLHTRITNFFKHTHFTISALLAPIGALIFIINTDGLDEILEETIGIVCVANRRCEDMVGDIGIWFIGTAVTLFLIYYLPYIIGKLLVEKPAYQARDISE